MKMLYSTFQIHRPLVGTRKNCQGCLSMGVGAVKVDFVKQHRLTVFMHRAKEDCTNITYIRCDIIKR